MNKEPIYRTEKKMFEALGLKRQFESKHFNNYPFNFNIEDFEFQWASVLIPRGDIEKILWRKTRDENYNDLNTDIKMVAQIPFLRGNAHFGIINVNLSLSFRYDKQFKYGDVTKTLAETCLFILKNSKKSNDFFMLESDVASEFLNYYVLNSQYGLGAITATSAPSYSFDNTIEESDGE